VIYTCVHFCHADETKEANTGLAFSYLGGNKTCTKNFGRENSCIKR
jgi:hypothetical protein